MNKDNHTKIDILRPAGKDLISKLIIEKGHKGLIIAIATTVFFCLIPLILSLISGSFINKNLKADGLGDLGYMIQSFIMMPFFIYFLHYYFDGLNQALHS
jgi:hypothetical protein